eukprot:gb/GECG01000894.1/.p1 GENE.gb/GECG01000894.1/~~gb/GECG01000894.1/.p1  ORF type:complete len:118 (+),score=12.70 gb/GECG01000894.1/:1-354(+)
MSSQLLENLPIRNGKAFTCLETSSYNHPYASSGRDSPSSPLSPSVWEQSIPSPRLYTSSSQPGKERNPPVIVSRCHRDDELFAQLKGHCIGLLRSSIEPEPQEKSKQRKLQDCWKNH